MSEVLELLNLETLWVERLSAKMKLINLISFSLLIRIQRLRELE